MEEQYWKRFMETGAVADYLGYRMEGYGHLCSMHTDDGSREKDRENCRQECCTGMSGQKEQE